MKHPYTDSQMDVFISGLFFVVPAIFSFINTHLAIISFVIGLPLIVIRTKIALIELKEKSCKQRKQQKNTSE